MLNITNHQGNADQTTVRYHLTPVGMILIKKKRDVKVGEGVEKRALVHC